MSFLQDFMLYNSGNECPKPYVLWTGYGLLSAAVGHKVFIDMEYFFTRCDTYIILIGPSGGRKTVAMTLGLDLLIEAIPDLNVSGDNETYQGIITFLDADNSTRQYMQDTKLINFKPYHIFAEELMDYLQLNPIAMVTFLTNVYGKNAYKYRLKGETRFVEHPYITLLACSVPEWLTDQLKAKQFSEGYGRRAILVCHEGIVKCKPTLTEPMKRAREACVKRIKQVEAMHGQVKVEPDAYAHFWKWYLADKPPVGNIFLTNWHSTLHILALKVAMLTSISERDDLVITLDHICLALALLADIEKALPMVTSRMGKSEINEGALFLLRTLKNNGGKMNDKELKMATITQFRNPLEQYSTLEYLKTTGQIMVVKEIINGVERRFVGLPENVRKV